MLGEVEISRTDYFGNVVERFGVNEYRAEERLLRDKREGKLSYKFVIHFKNILIFKFAC